MGYVALCIRILTGLAGYVAVGICDLIDSSGHGIELCVGCALEQLRVLTSTTLSLRRGHQEKNIYANHSYMSQQVPISSAFMI